MALPPVAAAAPTEASSGSSTEASSGSSEEFDHRTETDEYQADPKAANPNYDPRRRPAQDGAYQYRQMGLAIVVMGFVIALLVWLVRRQARKPHDRRYGS